MSDAPHMAETLGYLAALAQETANPSEIGWEFSDAYMRGYIRGQLWVEESGTVQELDLVAIPPDPAPARAAIEAAGE